VQGQAANTQAINQFVQAWSRQDQVAQWAARSIEVRQDTATTGGTATPAPPGTPAPAGALRFELRAARPGSAASAPPPKATPTPLSPAAAARPA
jgi:hypothetical protein